MSTNERTMEHRVLKELGIDLTKEENDDYWIYPQGNTNDPLVNKILKKSGGKPKFCPFSEFLSEVKNSKGHPEYVIRLKKKPIIFLIECKSKVIEHQSKNLDKPASFNIDGLLYYSKYFKDDFTVLGLAISGSEKNNCRISYFEWKKNQNFNPENIQKLTKLKTLKNYLPFENEKVFDFENVRTSAEKINELVYQGLSFKVEEKPFFISACLIALKNEDFRNEFSNKTTPKILIGSCKQTIDHEIDEVQDKEKGKKYDDLKERLKRVISNNEKLSSTPNNEKNSFVNILSIINKDVRPYINQGDVIGEFYHEFLKYSTGNGGDLGIVLTPSHIADLFCDLALKELGQEKFTNEDRVLDICCGTGSFLVSAFHRGISRNNIYGTEIDADMSNLALTNMILWGDGKSNIYPRRDCFDKEIKKIFKEANCNLAFLNPPYSQKKKKNEQGKSEIEFIENACNLLKKGGLAIAIVPLSSAIGTKYKEEREKIMKKHTLKAVMTMPSDLFSGNKSGSHACVMVWKSGEPHSQQTQTWLANWKDDGFVVLKGKRFDKENRWSEIKKQWINDYCQKKDNYSSVFQTLDYKDCWLADAWVETDYSKLTEKNFEKTIRDYLAFRISVLEGEDLET